MTSRRLNLVVLLLLAGCGGKGESTPSTATGGKAQGGTAGVASGGSGGGGRPGGTTASGGAGAVGGHAGAVGGGGVAGGASASGGHAGAVGVGGASAVSGGGGATPTGGAGQAGAPGASAGGATANCSVAFGQATAPVVVAATLSCSNGVIEQVEVGAGTGSNGFVSLGANMGLTPSYFFDIGTTAARVEPIAADAIDIRMANNRGGAVGIAETVRGAGTPRWFSRSVTGANATWTSTAINDSMLPSAPIAAALGPDGTRYAAFLQLQQGTAKVALATQPAAGGAFTTTALVPETSDTESYLAVEATGTPHVLYWVPMQGLVDWQPGRSLVTALASNNSTFPSAIQTVRPNDGTVALSLLLGDGVHVVRRRADGMFDEIALPFLPTPFPPPIITSCNAGLNCPSVTQQGDFARGQALAAASDGTLWLATVRDHLDRLVSYTRGTGGACQCTADPMGPDDKSWSKLAIQKIAAGSTTPSDVLWSVDLGAHPWIPFTVNNNTLSASFAGTMMFVSVIGPDGHVRYFVVDTATLK